MKSVKQVKAGDRKKNLRETSKPGGNLLGARKKEVRGLREIRGKKSH